MQKEILKGDWKILKGKLKEQWGKLTDDDLTLIEGKRDQLAGIIQKRYGLAKDAADKQIKQWEKSCEACCEAEQHATSCHKSK